MVTKTRLHILVICGLTLMIVFCVRCMDNVHIKVLGEDSANLRAMESLKNKCEDKIGVKIDFRPNTFEDAIKKADQDFANGTGLYDIILQVNFSLSSFVRNEYVYPLDELTSTIAPERLAFENNIFPNAWREVGFYYKNSKLVDTTSMKIGYPFATNTMLLVCNKDMFESEENQRRYRDKFNEDLTVPTEWDQYKRIASFFTDKEKGTYGVCMQGAADGWLYYEYCVFLYGLGGKIFDKNFGWEGNEQTPILITSDVAKKATTFYLDMKEYNAGNYLTIDANEQIKILKKGKVAMGIIWSDYLHSFVQEAHGAYDFIFAPLPGGKSPLAGGCFYVNKKSKYSKESIEYIINLMQPATQVELAKKGLCSPLRSTYENEEIKHIPYSDALRQSLENGVYMFEAGPECKYVMNTVTKQIQRLWAGEINVDKALTQIRAEIYNDRRIVYDNLNCK